MAESYTAIRNLLMDLSMSHCEASSGSKGVLLASNYVVSAILSAFSEIINMKRRFRCDCKKKAEKESLHFQSYSVENYITKKVLVL